MTDPEHEKFLAEVAAAISPEKRLDTAFSVIFLKGALAYKLKRPVRNDFLDYSTLENRRKCCEREFLINSRNSPALYRGVTFVRRNSAGSLELRREGEGAGAPAEYLVEMNRFEEEQLLKRLAAAGRLPEDICDVVAEKISSMHRLAPRLVQDGFADKFLGVVEIISGQFRSSAGGLFPAGIPERVRSLLRRAFDRGAGALERRGRDGMVRECHGDLHLGNICLFGGEPLLFDAVEFNREFTDVDTLYDLAFLLMDLKHHGLERFAAKLADRYAADTATSPDDYAALMPLYLGLRSVIRSSIAAASVRNGSVAGGAAAESGQYLREAEVFLA